MFGLQEKDIMFILNCIKKYPEIEAVGIFGSRANETYNETSDIDIVLYGKEINYMIIEEVMDVLENHSPYPFYVDIIHYEEIRDSVFKEEIDKHVLMI